jgi:hypothetical protein
MAGEGGDRAGEHRRAADRAVLLGAAITTRPRAPAGRDNKRRHAHENAPVNKNGNNINSLLHCGKTIIAATGIDQYRAQGKIMEFSCIKIMHNRSDPSGPARQGYTA